jgi:large subunit ribosomal protein L10
MRLKASEQMARELAGGSDLVLLDPFKMTAAQSVELRAEIRRAGARMRLLKNAVVRHALERIGHKPLAGSVGGMSAVVWGGDTVAALKALFGYIAKHKVPAVRGGAVDGKPVDPRALEELSRLPSRQELLGQFVGTMAAPLTGFAAVLGVLAGQFVQVLDAVRREKEKSAS